MLYDQVGEGSEHLKPFPRAVEPEPILSNRLRSEGSKLGIKEREVIFILKNIDKSMLIYLDSPNIINGQ